MTRLSEIQEAFTDARRANADLLYPESATWSDATTCRFKVGSASSSRAAPDRLNTNPLDASLRRLKIHPDDPEPALGANVAYQGGQLVLGAWTDTSTLGEKRSGLCRLVDARAYPVLAVSKAGQRLRLLIIARTGNPITAGSGSQDVRADLGVSHTAHTPPGVVLQVGDELVTSAGDRYAVLPPVQRDVLGDTLGLSYLGSELAPTIPDEGQPDVPPATNPADSDDPWWTQ